jgi:uncharacterized membrane protein YhaH (DUF805 family)
MESCVFVQHGPETAPVVWFVLALLIAFVVLVVTAIKLLICCKIFSKAGYSWALGLLMLIPIVNIIMAFFIAFADWPVQKELRRLRQQQNQQT